VRRARPADQISLVFCDLDFDRASRPFGRGAYVPPEGWAIGRAGLVYGEWTGREMQLTGDELIEGPNTASRLVATLTRGRRLIVGHGILTCDLLPVSTVTTVPGQLLAADQDAVRGRPAMAVRELEPTDPLLVFAVIMSFHRRCLPQAARHHRLSDDRPRSGPSQSAVDSFISDRRQAA
jgi:hypothetical protein